MSDSIFIAREPIDFRKGIHTLCASVIDLFSQPPQSGLFIFYNHQRNKLKLLGWHRNGFMLVQKVLEKGKFFVSLKDQAVFQITEEQLSWLLAGLNWPLMSSSQDCKFDCFF